jgi:hypothetical protein
MKMARSTFKYKLTGFARFILFMGVFGTLAYFALPYIPINKGESVKIELNDGENFSQFASKIKDKIQTKMEEKKQRKHENSAEIESLKEEVEMLRKELDQCKGTSNNESVSLDL